MKTRKTKMILFLFFNKIYFLDRVFWLKRKVPTYGFGRTGPYRKMFIHITDPRLDPVYTGLVLIGDSDRFPAFKT